MSHHFRVIREAGLVWMWTDGPAHMNDLRRDELDRRFPGLLPTILTIEGISAAYTALAILSGAD
jgi:hypothetical protein